MYNYIVMHEIQFPHTCSPKEKHKHKTTRLGSWDKGQKANIKKIVNTVRENSAFAINEIHGISRGIYEMLEMDEIG